MMKWIPPLFLLLGFSAFSQSISVNDTSHSPFDLANLLMENSCVEVYNVSTSSSQAVAYFNNNGGAFPFDEGVVIRTGIADFSAGSYTGQNMSSQLNSNSDSYLSQLNANSGQSTLITDVAFLEFDFVPLSTNFHFEFLFASNEYGEWQCLSSDVFAFLLTDLNTNTTTNLAMVPGTNLPVSVRNIKDNDYNPTCQSVNATFFESYEVNNASSTINMRGYTVVMNAKSGITPGNPYRIRMVIGDSNDEKFDSAIFLKAGSFNTSIHLGSDRVICDGDEFTLRTRLDTSVYNHVWKLNGTPIPGETGNKLVVDQSGVYSVVVTKNGSGCLLEDEIVFSPLQVQSPMDLSVCFSGNNSYTYDLSENDENALGINPNRYDLEYYASFSDLIAGNPVPSAQINAFQSPGNQKIYIKITNTSTNKTCDATYEFDLLVNPQISLQTPSPIEICSGFNGDIDLTQRNSQIIGGNFDFYFFDSATNAQNNSNPIANPTAYPVPSGNNGFSVWVRVEDADMPECFGIIELNILVNPLPPVDNLPEIIECSSFALPPLTNGNYFSGPNGTGTSLFAGDIIDETGTYYIFTGPDANGCTNQTSFGVTLLDEYSIEETHCGEFTIPTPPAGGFYTAAGGPNGTGTQLPSGTVLTTSQTIYYYAEVNGVLCRDEAYNIVILPLPPVDSLPDVVTCDQYVLPVLANGNYFTKTQGGGNQLQAGDAITSTQTIFIFSDDGTCTDQTKFKVTILPDFQDVDACGSYTLPQLSIGGFYTQASGQGQQIPDGSVLTTTQTLYYYAQTTDTPNCTENLSFTVTVIPIPSVDSLSDFLVCEDDPVVLPPLVDGEYFSATDRGGTQFFPGDTISSTMTIFINNLVNGCDNETDFHVEVRPIPEVPIFTDIYVCEPFELPPLDKGDFFTEPGGNGTMLQAGQFIDTTQIVYIYNDYDDLTTCNNEVYFTVYVQGIEVGEYDDIPACDEYILPDLPVGEYFTQTRGEGTQLFPGDTISVDTEVFVYGQNGVRFPCTDEDSFMVTISETPELPVFDDIEACGSYVLPELSQEDYDVGYYFEPGGENPVQDLVFSEAGNYSIYVYATAKDNPGCFDAEVFELTVYPLPEMQIQSGTICFDAQTGKVVSPVLLESGLDPAEFTVNWYFNGNLVHSGPEFSATEAGTYTVETEKLTPEVGSDCNYAPATVKVYESAQPKIRANVTKPFSDVANITVEVIAGVGEYEFQLDDQGFGSENVFQDVESGTHVIRVRGVNGACGEAVLEVEVLKFPKFFTPNNDGYNDRWNIPDLKNHSEAKILIFDRYGKLLAQIKPSRSGWNGSYNGKPLPSDDYWFVVSFEQEGKKKEFKANFSLIR